MNIKSRIYPAVAVVASILAFLYAVYFIEMHRPPASLLKDVDLGNFEQVVLDSKTPVFIEFYRRSCQPCDQEVPLLNALVQQYRGRVVFVRIDLDRNLQLANAMHIGVAPTHVFFDPTADTGFAKAGFADSAVLVGFIEHGLHPPAMPTSPSPTLSPGTPHPSVILPGAPTAPKPAPFGMPDTAAPAIPNARHSAPAMRASPLARISEATITPLD
jgi:thiol-disulfide isomerase/thioredoxin